MNLGRFVSAANAELRQNGISGIVTKFVDWLAKTPPISDDFDRRLGTDTATMVPSWLIRTTSLNAKFANRYQTAGGFDLVEAMKLLDRAPDDLIFVDLGSGKGRKLIEAGQLGFKQVIGVEFSDDLVAIAHRNLEIVGMPRVIVVRCDAAKYDIPDGDIVVYFYNPFKEQVMRDVIKNLERAAASQPEREMFVIYSRPESESLFQAASFLEFVGRPAAHLDTAVWKKKRM